MRQAYEQGWEHFHQWHLRRQQAHPDLQKSQDLRAGLAEIGGEPAATAAAFDPDTAGEPDGAWVVPPWAKTEVRSWAQRRRPRPVRALRRWWMARRDRTVAFVQRGRRGWSHGDLLTLDRWLAQVLSTAITAFAADTNWAPQDLSWEEWQAALAEMAAGLQAHADTYTASGGAPGPQFHPVGALADSLALFGRYYGHLWW